MSDAEEDAAKTPIRVALSSLRAAAKDIRASAPETLELAGSHIATAKGIAIDQKDHALNSALAAFEAYIMVTGPVRQLDPAVLGVALSALEQLAMLPLTYVEARDSVAIALGKAIQKRLAA